MSTYINLMSVGCSCSARLVKFVFCTFVLAREHCVCVVQLIYSVQYTVVVVEAEKRCVKHSQCERCV